MTTVTTSGGVTTVTRTEISVTIFCTRCGRGPYDEDLGYTPAFASADQAVAQLTSSDGCWGWHVVTRRDGTRELVCQACGCVHLGHQPRSEPPYRWADGRILGSSTWCGRCGELLASEPGEPAPPGYPVAEKDGIYLQWDAAALPEGRDIGRAAWRLLARLTDLANAGRWDAFSGPQDGRPQPTAKPDPDRDAVDARILFDAARLLLPGGNRQEAL